MDNMIDEHIKDYSQKYECPKGKLYCEYGESDCKYFKGSNLRGCSAIFKGEGVSKLNQCGLKAQQPHSPGQRPGC